MIFFNKTQTMLFSIVFFISFFFSSCGDDGDSSVMSSGDLVEFTIDGTSYALDASNELATNLGVFTAGGFSSVSASGLIANGAGSTMDLSFGFEGLVPGTYSLSGGTLGTNEGLRLILRSGLTRTGDYEAATITLNVTRFDLSGDNPDVEATFSGTLEDPDGQQLQLTNGRIRVLP